MGHMVSNGASPTHAPPFMPYAHRHLVRAHAWLLNSNVARRKFKGRTGFNDEHVILCIIIIIMQRITCSSSIMADDELETRQGSDAPLGNLSK